MWYEQGNEDSSDRKILKLYICAPSAKVKEEWIEALRGGKLDTNIKVYFILWLASF